MTLRITKAEAKKICVTTPAQNRKSKYNARKVRLDGITFDSKVEAKRYAELLMLERAGAISDLKRQVEFTLIPAQKIDGKCVERACKYKADFVYTENGKRVVEDVKGLKTKDYIIKRKLMLYVHGVRIKEVNKNA